MSSKKKVQQAKYCQIFQWVENQDPEFADAIKNLCMVAALSPGGGATGVTFLYPKEDAYRAEIVKKTYNDDADEAVKMIGALIIPDILQSGGDWKTKQVGSHDGVLYTVESASAKAVTLKGDGGSVKLEPVDFKTLAKKEGRIAIWAIVSGRLPMSGDPYKRPRRARDAKAATKGGASGGHGAHFRSVCAHSVQMEYCEAMKRDRARTCNPFLSKVVGLLRHLRKNRPEVFQAVQPLLDWSPEVTFYLLVEPFKCDGPYIISDGDLHDWGGIHAFGDVVAEYKSIINSEQKDAGALIYRDPKGTCSQIDRVRRRLIGSAGNALSTPKGLVEVYQALATSNAINGAMPVLPDATRALVPGLKKLWQDEFRFVFYNALQEVRARPFSERDLMGVFCNICEECFPGNNCAVESKFAKGVEALKERPASREETFGEFVRFINSTNFLYFARVESEVGTNTADRTNPEDLAIYNQAADELRRLAEIHPDTTQEISKQALAELKAYVDEHKKLPGEVAALVA